MFREKSRSNRGLSDRIKTFEGRYETNNERRLDNSTVIQPVIHVSMKYAQHVPIKDAVPEIRLSRRESYVH